MRFTAPFLLTLAAVVSLSVPLSHAADPVAPVRPRAAAAATPKRSAEAKPNLGAWITEIMRMDMQENGMDLTMWLPTDFFVAAGQSKGATAEEADREMAFLKPYLLILVCRENEADDGTKTFASEDQVRASSVLTLADGTEVKAIDKVPPRIATVAATLRVAMAQNGGVQAENMHLLLFPAADKGRPVVDADKQSKVTLTLKEGAGFKASTSTWHTPFDAKTPPHPCSKCGEPVSAKWDFCPFCGEKADHPATKAGAKSADRRATPAATPAN